MGVLKAVSLFSQAWFVSRLHLLKDKWPRVNQVIVTDLDGNGRPDIAACAEHGSYELRWWRILGPSQK